MRISGLLRVAALISFTSAACADKKESAQGPVTADVTEVPATGIVLFVEADHGLAFGADGKVSKWIDQSGLAHDGEPLQTAAVRGATLGGSAAVGFSGSGGPTVAAQGLAFGSGYNDFSKGFTSFALVRVEDPGAPVNDILLAFPELRGDSENATIGVNGMTSEGMLNLSYSVGEGKAAQQVEARVAAASRWALVSVVHEPSGMATIFVDGSVVGQGSVQNPTTSARTASLFGGVTKAEAALLLVYDRALSSSERAMVERYVSNKWPQR